MESRESRIPHHPSRPAAWAVAIIAIGGIVPLALFWWFVGQAPGVSTVEARELLGADEPDFVLVDMRPADAYEASHLPGASNWPYGELMKAASAGDVPPELKSRRLLLLTPGGLRAAHAAKRLTSLGVADARAVRGGMQAWIALQAVPDASPDAVSPEEFPHFRASPFYEQLAGVVSGFVVKPLYMLMALVVVVVLRRSRAADLRALKWALVFFLAGESACAANFILYREKSILFEYLHSFPMAVTFGFTAYAVFEGLDARVFKYSSADEKCAAVELCRSCYKYAAAPCSLRRLFLVIIPASAALAFMPLTGKMSSASYNTSIFGTYYNYSHHVSHQLFEIRYCPAAAIVLFAISFLVLVLKKNSGVAWSKVFFAAGSGALGFAMLRWTLLAGYRNDLVWFAFWEEATEFIYVAGVAWALWLFRKGLFATGGA